MLNLMTEEQVPSYCISVLLLCAAGAWKDADRRSSKSDRLSATSQRIWNFG